MKSAPPKTPLAEVSPQLLGDIRDRSDDANTDDAPTNGIALLEDMEDRLSLEGRELQRMEYEGGLPLGAGQKAKANACLKASQRIKTLLRVTAKKSRSKKIKNPQ